MALMKCHECGSEVSSEAKACPKCGAKMPKKTRMFTKLVAGFLGLGVVMAVISENNRTPPVAKVLTPAQTAQEKAKKEQETKIMMLAAVGAKTLKNSSKDPQTFEFTSIDAHPNTTICYEYRAKNSFNAMLAGSAVLTGGKMLVQEHAGNTFVTAWNKNCTKPDGYSVIRIVQRLIES